MSGTRLFKLLGLTGVMIALCLLCVLPAVPALAAPDLPGHCSACWQHCYIWGYGWVCCSDHHDGTGACIGVQGPGHCILAGAGCLVVVVTP